MPITTVFVYGMSPQGFQKYSKDEYGIDFTLEECEIIREAFFGRPNGYYRLPVYHEYQKGLARRQGYVESVLGRRRRLPNIHSDDKYDRSEAERQAVNMPIQSLSSDLGLLGMYHFWKEVKTNTKLKKVKPLWFIHDAIYFMAPENQMHKAMLMLKDCMEARAKEYIHKNFGVLLDYPIESDGKTGTSWATMEDFEA